MPTNAWHVTSRPQTDAAALCNINPGRNVMLYAPRCELGVRTDGKKLQCLIDSGSERSFIRESIGEQSNLSATEASTITIQIFGSWRS